MRSHLLSLAAISLTAFALIPLSPATAGDLYKWTDEKGQVHYSSTPPPDTAKKAKTLDTKALSKINALPSDPNADQASVDSPTDDSNASTPATPAKTASGNTQETAPASPPALIPASLLPPSNPPATVKPEQPAQSDLVEVVAQGMGTDANAALLNAYSNAVQQALGSYVDAETLVQNDQIVRDKILTYSKGFIEKADIVSQNQANGLFQVNIRAKVKRQQLLEQAKTNNISVKAVEGVSLHAQVESQIKQEKDAKALLEKALLPLLKTTFHRAELAPSTKEQPNPTINKAGTDDNFVTLDYKVSLWIDEPEYLKYVKNNLIPVLDQIATDKEEFTRKFENNKMEEDIKPTIIIGKDQISISVLVWKDKALTSSKWRLYVVSKDSMPPQLTEKNYSKRVNTLGVELSLVDESNEIVALGKIIDGNDGNIINFYSLRCIEASGCNIIRIAPYFSSFYNYYRIVIPPKSHSATVSVKISKEDLPRVKSAKLEVKSAGGE